ncbi:MAG: pantoate--beta-alanine ligase [Pseudomonadota bacterium]
MLFTEDLSTLREHIKTWKQEGLIIGFVPTMGNLHEGHLSLIEEALNHCDRVVSSIFVNPLQFSANEDLDTYPRTLAEDKKRLQAIDTSLLFSPSAKTIYPKPLSEQTLVSVPTIGQILCGASRPGHFAGVATVVAKLFNMVQPDIAVFGKKDYQQLHIIRKMTEDLNLPIQIIGVETCREASGLAMSSRNGYLSDEDRCTAAYIKATLDHAAEALQNEHADYVSIENHCVANLSSKGFNVDYFVIRSRQTLFKPSEDTKQLVILVAAYLGKTRLIDNLEVTLE